MNNDEIVKRLNRIIDDAANVDTVMRLRNLRNELKPKPNFLEGELVLNNGTLSYFSKSRMFEYKGERLEIIPIHFIEWSGGDRPCIGLVVVKLRGGSNNAYPLYDVRRGECLTWNHHGDTTDIIGYHQIEDLEDENRKHLKHSIRGGE